MKYSKEIKMTKLNDRGLAIDAGWVVVYQVNPTTREYQKASYEYLMQGVGVSAGSYVDEPDFPTGGKALRRTENGQHWEHVPDYRGEVVYSTKNHQPQQVTELGELSSDVTLFKPVTEFDTWSGTAWVIDLAAQQASAVKSAQQELGSRKAIAASRVNELTYAVNLDIATDTEKSALKEWQKYTVLLSRIDTTASSIQWPDAPVTI
ncbi:tail fiber assembly protein [Pectobacterium versatile]|uniref:tail fiber assembly protein n=1 Tax=Pectobacterium versatile TaxID=2488639 RepID=UPI001FFD3649|nr:tail fiber assembly protein [Pectobacterium versatile]